uniref:Uncharacterized protein n=1 Tax=Knipowitschia caucasica TaxID=637954 RepID=A0AAV2KH84_KNICA
MRSLDTPHRLGPSNEICSLKPLGPAEEKYPDLVPASFIHRRAESQDIWWGQKHLATPSKPSLQIEKEAAGMWEWEERRRNLQRMLWNDQEGSHESPGTMEVQPRGATEAIQDTRK